MLPALAADGRISRKHASVSFDGSKFWAADAGSQNGTFADGRQLRKDEKAELRRILRIGDSIMICLPDLQPLQVMGVKTTSGKVFGPAMQQHLHDAEQAAKNGHLLFVSGESGTGKELVAQAFHAGRGIPGGQFIPVNCANIPATLAERLLFGSRKGAYSGADKDTDGYVQAASGGTLFLDEIGDLAPELQPKLLRLIETHEYFPLGSSRPITSAFHFCSATNRDLRALMASGSFREDLYYRINQPTVSLPPLRKRPEEVAFIIQEAVCNQSVGCAVHASLVEACLLQPWPGNVRELLAEVSSAALRARSAGCPRVEERHLSPTAGMAVNAAKTVEYDRPSPRVELPTVVRDVSPEQQRLEAALREHQGNVTRAAQSLGIPRTHVYRLLHRYGLMAKREGDSQGSRCTPRSDD